ncbi:two-component regulator propeller domain-containing protein [Flavobacterium sp. MC2016-06]|uniref:ligand-binding sensor domain-containing protein n=1 Tax=Flavobacterium sp. MC2016-06 TaxID=2676308 RepID=UPI0012BA7271|nr:two-component regulator propeller domain-containing protein [Flavobacterium sp. MC2016-06]MBU3857769.1 hypothetical protein [Flavobacterium sp. MC2016-06]
MKKDLFKYLIILSWFIVPAQNKDPFFKTYTSENGLSNDKVNTLLEDSRGFLWIGTEDGLNRFDGRYYTIFRNIPHQNNCLSGNIITDILEDKDGVIWVATADGGLTKYDFRLATNKQFTQYKHSNKNVNSIPENGINKIIDDGQGNIWLATSGSNLIQYNKKLNRFFYPIKIGPKAILSLTMGINDTLWAGRAGGGILKVNVKTLKYKNDSRYADLYKNLPHVSVSALYKDKSNSIWYGSWDKNVYNYDTKTNIEKVYTKNNLIDDEIVSFAEDKNKIWMAGKNTGITTYDKKSHEFYNLRNTPFAEGSIASDHTNVVYVSKKGIVWVGTNNGLSMYNPLFKPFQQHFLPKEKEKTTVYDFFEDEKKNLWIGTSEGIYIKPFGKEIFEHKILSYHGQKLSVTKFFKDVDGTIYLGTNYTLFKYFPAENRIEILPGTENDPVMKQVISSRVVSIVRDTIEGHAALVVSPYGHYLTYYDLVAKKWISRQDKQKKIVKKLNLQDNLIRKFYRDRNGKIWLATNHHGLGIWTNQQLKPIQYFSNDPADNNSISSNHIFDMQQDKNNNFWVSTYGGGLNFYNLTSKKFTHVPYSSNLTEGLQLDKSGNLWMICNGHIHKYEPNSKIYSCYDLPNLQKSNSLKGYLYRDSENKIYGAGENYYIVFDPKTVEKINHSPKVYLTDFKIFDKSFSHLIHQDILKLDYPQNYFTIEFSAPDFSGDNIKYAYKLEGIDKNWHESDKLNTANYSNLPSGKYRFLVRASNWIGGYTGTYTSIKIIITPPFWATWWFVLLMLLLCLSIGYFIYLYRINNLQKNKMIRNRIAQDLHDQIGSTLSSISIYSKVAKIYQEQNNPDQLQNVLLRISDSANEMISEMGDIVWALNSKNDSFKSIINRINSYAKPLCSAKNIKFEFICDPQLMDVNFDMQIRKNIFLIIKEALNNGIKHSLCSYIDITMKVKNQLIILEITDDGVGFSTDHKSDSERLMAGNGLTNIKLRAAELKAEMEIVSREENGTSIKLTFKCS